MKQLKQIGLHLMLIVMILLLLWMSFPTFWEDCVTSAATGRQEIEYARAAVNSNGVVYAVGRQEDNWQLVRGTDRGRERVVRLDQLELNDVKAVGPLHVLADDGVLLTTYEQREDLVCRLYYIDPACKGSHLLFSVTCQNDSREDVSVSGFAESGGTAAFLVEMGTETAAYRFAAGGDGVRKMIELTEQQKETVLFALPDGSLALLEDRVLVAGGDRYSLPGEVMPCAGWLGQDCSYILDGRTAALWRLETDRSRSQEFMTLEDNGGVIDLNVSRDGHIVILTDSGTLLVCWDGQIKDISGMLYRPRWQSVLLLVIGAVGAVLGALILWYVLWEMRKMQISLVVRYGAGVAATLLLLTAAAIHWIVVPHYAEQAETAGESYLRTATLAAPEPVVDPLGADWDFDKGLTTRAEYVYALWRAFGCQQVPVSNVFQDVAQDSPYLMAVEWALAYNVTAGISKTEFGPNIILNDEQAFTFLYRAMRYIGGDRMVLVREEDTLYRIENDGEKTALTALLTGNKFRDGAQNALETGRSFIRYCVDGEEYYAAFTRTEADQLSVLSTSSKPYRVTAEQGAKDTARLLWCASAIAIALVLVALGGLSRSLKRVTRGMTAIQNGSYVEVIDHNGDEVSAMAKSLNAMASTIRDADVRQHHHRDVYKRFMPNQISELLGVKSVENINKDTFASRMMTTMHVSFSFDDHVYESRSKELFENINEVTECTARIASAQGGTILSFSHNGFDALFAPDTSAPISAAVAIRQEIIAVNRERSRKGLSLVALRVTLDSGEVMLGVVGDETRMQATAVSSSFNTARVLDALFTRFDANILCTERIQRWAGEYGSRYIGKTHDGGELIRVYEIYDGDPYLVRNGKKELEKTFAEGVYTLYAGEYAEAKKTFIEIVRRNSGDGAARYYLYLADRFEKEPPAEVCLDC